MKKGYTFQCFMLIFFQEQAKEVINAYQDDFPDLKIKLMDGWVLLTGQKLD